jgi:TRAP-type uncharacterized transport system fused permease subunit
MTNEAKEDITPIKVEGVDDEPIESNRRLFTGKPMAIVAFCAMVYAAFHMAALNGLSLSGMTGGIVDVPWLPEFPLETWNFRIVHIAGALALGFVVFAGASFTSEPAAQTRWIDRVSVPLLLAALFAAGVAVWFAIDIAGGAKWNGISKTIKFNETWLFGAPLLVATVGGIVLSWFHKRDRDAITMPDLVLAVCAMAVAIYLIVIFGTLMRNATGTPFAPIGISLAAVAGTLLIMELTRRVAGLALVVIAAVFVVYVFVGHTLPGFLNSPEIEWARFFSQVYTDAGILGPTTAVSSTYIILFIIFAAFLQSSKVGEYFVNFAFALAGRARGGPAKVAIFASGLMGMINGTSAGNVVATGSLTIPLMKKVGYDKKTAGAIEAAAIAAVIPAILYFVSIYFMVDLEAAKRGMRGMRDDELPKVAAMLRQVFLFLPIVILIVALFMGYSVIRAGTLATACAAVVSWFTPYPMGFKSILKSFENAGQMAIQIIAVCACAGVIVGVISLTGVGARFSNLLLEVADKSQLLAMFFAMCISILLGMGMPTTAAYAVAASVVAPGLVALGVPLLTAHFFVFYFAVVSAPPQKSFVRARQPWLACSSCHLAYKAGSLAGPLYGSCALAWSWPPWP